jgi:hypothetical protein
MQKQTIIDIINTKISEHQVEITGCEKYLQQHKVDMKAGKVVVEGAQIAQVFIMKDKFLFHRAASQVLDDLKKDIEALNE